MRARAVDHVVLVCADVERSLAWWRETFGLTGVRVEEWRRGEAPFPSLRVGDGMLIDLVAGDRTGVNVAHLALEVDTPPDVLAAEVSALGLDVVTGPRPLFGARGTGAGLYVRDPDGNTVEIRAYD